MAIPRLPDLRTFLLTSVLQGRKPLVFRPFFPGMISARCRCPGSRLLNPITKEMHMTQTLFRRLALGVATLACVAWLPAVAGAATDQPPVVFDFKGTATDIGVQRGPGQIGGIEYRIEGKFETDVPLDLSKSTVTFHRFLDEEGGNGEMVLTTNNADLVCSDDSPATCDATLEPIGSSSSSKPTEGKYETPARFRPQMRVQIKSKDGEFKFNVRLDRGTSPQVLLPGGPTDAYLFPPDPVTGVTRQ